MALRLNTKQRREILRFVAKHSPDGDPPASTSGGRC
jgi:hypothetical protein